MIDPRFYTLADNSLSVADLCAKLDRPLPLEGTLSEARLSQPAPLAGSKKGDLCFLMGKRNAAQLESAGATACFVSQKLAKSVADRNIIPIVSDCPRYHFSLATSLLVMDRFDAAVDEGDERRFPKTHIHPSAVIGAGVEIGEGTIIGPNSVIEKAIIGRNCRIGSCTVIGGSGFGVAYGPKDKTISIPHVGRVVIGDHVRIGSNVCIDRGQLGDTYIGSRTQIDNLVQIAHNCQLGEDVVIAAQGGLSGSCDVGHRVKMGGGVGLADHISIGDDARLAAYAGVMHNVPAGETWSGIPAQPIRDHMKQIALARKALRK